MNLWPPPYQRVALTSWAICLYFWTSLWDLNPWKRALQTLPIITLARDDMGTEGIEPSPSVSHTDMLKPLQHIPHNISRRQDLNLQPLTSKASMLPFAPLPDFSEDRGHAPQTLSGSLYLAGRFWTFQICLPFCLIKKLPRCLFW